MLGANAQLFHAWVCGAELAVFVFIITIWLPAAFAAAVAAACCCGFGQAKAHKSSDREGRCEQQQTNDTYATCARLSHAIT